MINIDNFYELLRQSGISFFTGVPDSLLNDFCLYLCEKLTPEQHIISANEGNAIAVAAGYYLSTSELPLVYMQNSGLGNSVNPLISLTNKDTYSIPMVLLIGWRGSPGIEDWTHHMKQGKETTSILEILDIPWQILEDNEAELGKSISWASELALKIHGPVALLVKKGTLERGSKKDLLLEESKYSLSREEAIGVIVDTLPKDTVYVATTGRATRELYEVKKSRGMRRDRDFLNVGAMGHASSVALGLATGNPDQNVVCLDGDASAIMHMGSLAIGGTSGISNFMHVILNNGAHESVGGQPSAGHKIDFTGIAKSCGYVTVGHAISSRDELEAALKNTSRKEGPTFIDLRIRQGIRSDIPKLDVSLIEIKSQLMKALNLNIDNKESY